MLPFVCKRAYKEDMYKMYIAESLYAHGNNQRLTKRYADIITQPQVDPRTPEQIKDDIIKKAGLILNEPV